MTPVGSRRAAVVLRSVEVTDRAFLVELYRSTRATELALFPFDGAMLDAFVAQQFDAQDRAWAADRPSTTRSVVLVDGRPGGRLYVDRTADEVRVVDVALLPEHRGRGVGTALLQQVIRDADAAALPVTLHVERHNPAGGLYCALGFQVVEDLGVHLRMERPPAGRRAATEV